MVFFYIFLFLAFTVVSLQLEMYANSVVNHTVSPAVLVTVTLASALAVTLATLTYNLGV